MSSSYLSPCGDSDVLVRQQKLDPHMNIQPRRRGFCNSNSSSRATTQSFHGSADTSWIFLSYLLLHFLLTYSLNNSLIDSRARSLNPLLTHSLTRSSLTESHIHSPLTRSHTHPCVCYDRGICLSRPEERHPNQPRHPGGSGPQAMV